METFLYKTDKGLIDTTISVAPLSEVSVSQGETLETIGTVELRLYVTRQLNVSHTIGSVQKYDSPSPAIQDRAEQTASYKQIAPSYQMTFEPNCAPLEKSKSTREQRKMTVPRPGTEPWAIFRFHYRSKGENYIHIEGFTNRGLQMQLMLRISN